MDLEKKQVPSLTSNRLAIASLVISVLAMFGVVPLAIFPFFISCAVVDWTGCTDITGEDDHTF